MMNEPLRLRPLVWHWDEWRRVYEDVEARKSAAIKVNLGALPVRDKVAKLIQIGREWHAAVDAYVMSLSEQQREDVVDLLMSECALLWDTVDPSFGPRDERDFHEFRQRWFMASALERFVERHNFVRAHTVARMYRELELYGERVGWLP